MPCLAAVCQLLGRRAKRRPGWLRAAWALWGVLLLVGSSPAVRAQGVEVLELSARRDEPSIVLDYQLRVTLPAVVEDAARRGVPLYFTAQVTLRKPRWYWRDEHVARAGREWRLSYQPLTSSWRVSQGGLGQSHANLADALATMTRSAGWPIAEARAVEADAHYYIEFNWRLDTAQLPRPMQIGLGGIGGIGGASEWALGVERRLRLGPETPK